MINIKIINKKRVILFLGVSTHPMDVKVEICIIIKQIATIVLKREKNKFTFIGIIFLLREMDRTPVRRLRLQKKLRVLVSLVCQSNQLIVAKSPRVFQKQSMTSINLSKTNLSTSVPDQVEGKRLQEKSNYPAFQFIFFWQRFRYVFPA